MSEPALSLLSHLRGGTLLPTDNRLLIAVSGGMDSMALLHLYTRLRDESELTIAAATFDHGLRGEAGRQDAAHVEDLCRQWGVPCMTGYGGLDPSAPAVEARARAARYQFLAASAREFGAQAVATAHHADDQAETLILNLIRGAGTHGLSGMRRIAPLLGEPHMKLIRPLLAVRRAELEAYCRAENIPWRDDASNDDPRYRRNWVRHTVIPLLAEANPNIVATLVRTASVAAEQDSYLESQLAALVPKSATVTPGRVWIKREASVALHPALNKRLLAWAAHQLSETVEPDFAHLEAAAALLDMLEGRTVELGAGIDVVVDSTYFTISRRDAPWTPPHAGFWVDNIKTIVGTPSMASAQQNSNDSDVRIRVPPDIEILVRARRDGDRVYPRSMKGKSQKLKDWFINRKIPRQIRDHLPLIVAAGYIAALWDGEQWQHFAPPFDGETIEIDLTLR